MKRHAPPVGLFTKPPPSSSCGCEGLGGVSLFRIVTGTVKRAFGAMLTARTDSGARNSRGTGFWSLRPKDRRMAARLAGAAASACATLRATVS